ncbi:CxC2 domain-containing protein [Mycena indigotica]|uniref:CxC2 domain-containing protein n=1 Tax=Mycena indigotica TaxID=2126181 RepID=A0A8H6S5F0_9AGAR|nr:CxC2 domain-containing protein [Mycena indigotica]KAF7292673.1 CxC2 domain-containing protein [Mycena indigotica]
MRTHTPYGFKLAHRLSMLLSMRVFRGCRLTIGGTVAQAMPVLPPSPLKRLRMAALAPVAPSTIDIDCDAYQMGVGDDDWEEGQAAFGADQTPRVLRPAAWNGSCFVRHSLKALGLRIQLGHPPLQSCDRPIAGRDDFVLLHHGGVLNVSVDFCGCHLSGDPCYIQLLRAGMFPASTDVPRTCATFSCLDRYHSLTLQGKITGYDYYKSLEALTDATGLKPPDRYQVFLRMARQYRHLLLVKRGGRGYDQRGVLGTTPGELAVICPACPRPGVNLPTDWAKASPAQAYASFMPHFLAHGRFQWPLCFLSRHRTLAGTTGSDAEMEEALRIEWAKAYARVRRWDEEVNLLQEEWRRLPESFAHEENLWAQRAISVPVGQIPSADAEGMVAYTGQACCFIPKPSEEGREVMMSWGSITEETEEASINTDGDIEKDEDDLEDGNVTDEDLLLTGEVDDW